MGAAGSCPRTTSLALRVPGTLFADSLLLDLIREDYCIEQIANVACLPGIVGASMEMPDVHQGYGFPIGGVTATDADGDGVVSPGGVGFDINCGMRLLRSDLTESDVKHHIRDLVTTLFKAIHTGPGSGSKLRLRSKDVDDVLQQGGSWAVANGLGDPEDLEVTEERGALKGADLGAGGHRPKKRGSLQLGTLGSGNHFLEIQVVDRILDYKTAAVQGIHSVGQITVMIHTGSRGLGHQGCTDYLKIVDVASDKYGIEVPDRQLASVPISSPEGESYLGAMSAAANFAWANRQVIAHWARESFERVLGMSWQMMGMRQVYDVSHNIAKIERHKFDGKIMRLCVHRKGATRSPLPRPPWISRRSRKVSVNRPARFDSWRYGAIFLPGRWSA